MMNRGRRIVRMDGQQTHQWQAVNHSFTTRLYVALIRGSHRWGVLLPFFCLATLCAAHSGPYLLFARRRTDRPFLPSNRPKRMEKRHAKYRRLSWRWGQQLTLDVFAIEPTIGSLNPFEEEEEGGEEEEEEEDKRPWKVNGAAARTEAFWFFPPGFLFREYIFRKRTLFSPWCFECLKGIGTTRRSETKEKNS